MLLHKTTSGRTTAKRTDNHTRMFALELTGYGLTVKRCQWLKSDYAGPGLRTIMATVDATGFTRELGDFLVAQDMSVFVDDEKTVTVSPGDAGWPERFMKRHSLPV